jgi:hypothetical protein
MASSAEGPLSARPERPWRRTNLTVAAATPPRSIAYWLEALLDRRRRNWHTAERASRFYRPAPSLGPTPCRNAHTDSRDKPAPSGIFMHFDYRSIPVFVINLAILDGWRGVIQSNGIGAGLIAQGHGLGGNSLALGQLLARLLSCASICHRKLHPEGRIHIELINGPMLFEHKATPAEYGAGLKFAIERGWLKVHESGFDKSDVTGLFEFARSAVAAVEDARIMRTGRAIYETKS